MNKSTLPCVILAGGQSRRMGQNKALLPFAGSTLLEFQYNKMKGMFNQVWIACKKNQLSINGNMPLLIETQEESSPLFGLKNAFATLKCEKIFFITVDTPLVSYRAVKLLLEACSHQKADAWVMQSDQRTHPLVGIYSCFIQPTIDKSTQEKEFRLMRFLEKIECKKIHCGSEKQFINLNTPEAYKSLLQFEKETAC